MVNNFDEESEDLLGSVDIPLIDLYSQNRISEWYDLKNNGNNAQIYVELRWIHSKVKFYEDLIQVWEQ